jgi:hypothetical protein
MMTITLLLAGAGLAAAMGLYEAYSKKRGIFGWIVSIVASIVGGIALGMTLGMTVAGLAPATVSKEANLYVSLSGVLVGLVAGSAVALWLVNRFRG